MIKIKKSSNSPQLLDKNGNCKLTFETANNNSKYDANPNDYQLGLTKFEFKNDLYAHDDIKKILIECQGGKCAFCEQNVYSIDYGDIEHFRPKAATQQGKKDKLSKIGYYWLAYEWNNLLFSCTICNQRYKRNLFPLLDVNKRARDHHSNIRFEKPYFINPADENPKFLIKFNKEIAVGIDKKNRGKKTIEAIGLNRSSKTKGVSDLLEIRRDYLSKAELIYKISKADPSIGIPKSYIDEAKEKMKEYLKPGTQFLSMIQDNCPK